MARTTLDLEDELGRIWSLVGELAEQLQHNRAVVVQLKARSGNVKGQAAHVGTGFPLRRFNLDISDEEFHSELEKFATHLVLENQQLQHENKQLNSLLKEYEGTLEAVMGKFRGVAHASQQHDLSLHSYYTSLLQSLQTAHSSAQLHDDTSLSLLLTRLSTLLRSALRTMGGEEVDIDLHSLLLGNKGHKHAPSDPSSSTPPSPKSASGSSGKKSSSSGTRSLQRAPARPTPFPGALPGSSGGYAGTEGQGDWALEREMEIVRLEDENRLLREMLVIGQQSMDPLDTEAETGDGRDKEEEAKVGASGNRRSSLTVEELELGAEKEALERERRESLGLGMEVDAPSISEAVAMTGEIGGPGGGGAVGPDAGDGADRAGEAGPGGPSGVDGEQPRDEEGESGAGHSLGQMLASGIAAAAESGTRGIGTGLGGGAGVADPNIPQQGQEQGGRPVMEGSTLFQSAPHEHEHVFEEDGGEQ